MIARTLRGEFNAFEKLVERHRDVVFELRPGSSARTMPQTSARTPSYAPFTAWIDSKEPAPFRSWLLQITHNAALDSLARKQRLQTEPPHEEDTLPDRDPHRQPATQLERRERQQQLELKLRVLREDYRSLLVLRDLEELPYEDIAVALDMPLGSVKGRLHRARAELIELLRNNTCDWELPA